MDVHIRLFAAGILLMVMVVSLPADYPQRDLWSRFLSRRQTSQPECTSYSELQGMLGRKFSERIHEIVNNLFGTVVTREDLRLASVNMCRILSVVARESRNDLQNCPNSEEVMANMHIFSGLCKEDGTMTQFLNDSIAGFGTVNYARDNECSEQVLPVLMTCGSEIEPADPSKDMEGGPKAYKRMMIERELCLAKGFDKDNAVRACGDVESLKKLAYIMDLFFAIGPGVTFNLSDFEP